MRFRPPIWLLCTLAVAPLGCASRTVPLPPPTVQQVGTPDADGFVQVVGLGLGGATVGVLNETTQEGVLVPVIDDGDCDNACPWEARLRAERDHELRVWQFFESASSTFVLVR